jgi:hypothetical protein
MIKNLLSQIPGTKQLARWLGLGSEEVEQRLFLLEMLPKDSIGVEIGVHKGDFSCHILKIVRPRELHLVDPWLHEGSATYKDALYGGQAHGGQAEMDNRYKEVLARFASESRSGQVKIHRGYSNDVLEKFPDGYLDWVYIDGNHLYDFVLQDIKLSYRKVKPGGYITGDDYTEGGWWQGGVKKAADEFVRNNPVELVTTQQNQFVLKK